MWRASLCISIISQDRKTSFFLRWLLLPRGSGLLSRHNDGQYF
jgi:hypothetical protein